MSNGDSTISVYMKIRFYVMNEIFHKGHRVEKLASSRQLAKQFGVSQNTVQRALSQLVKEGYLISRKGVGNFINPAKTGSVPEGKRPVFIGIIIGDGMTFSFTEHPWCLLSSAGDAMIRKGFSVRHLQFPLLSDEELFEEIRQSYVDGLVWGIPTARHLPLIARLAASGMPVVAYNTKLIDGINSVMTDFEKATVNAGKRILAEGRRNVFFAVHSESSRTYEEGFTKVGGGRFDMTFFDDPATVAEDIVGTIDTGVKPDAFFLHDIEFGTVAEALRERGVDTARGCRLMGSEMLKYKAEYRGLVHVVPFEEAGMIAADMLDRMINRADFTVEHRVLDIDIEDVRI